MSTAPATVFIGVDVSKEWLDICADPDARTVEQIDNTRPAIQAWLARMPAGAMLGVESTNVYHLELVRCAHARGLQVFLVSGYRLKHYAKAVGQRMRNDAIDARLIRRYLTNERAELVPYMPKSADHDLLWSLMKRRAELIRQCVALRQSWREVTVMRDAFAAAEAALKQFIAQVDDQVEQLTVRLNWRHDLARLRAVPGIGPLSALALLAAYHSGTFRRVDAFIAYLGLDVRAKDSGKTQGPRRLTRHGDGEYRRLLYCAAMAAARKHEHFKARYEALLKQGRARTEALVIVSRRLAKIGFTLLRQQTSFDPSKLAPV
jgi:transposase